MKHAHPLLAACARELPPEAEFANADSLIAGLNSEVTGSELGAGEEVEDVADVEDAEDAEVAAPDAADSLDAPDTADIGPKTDAGAETGPSAPLTDPATPPKFF